MATITQLEGTTYYGKKIYNVRWACNDGLKHDFLLYNLRKNSKVNYYIAYGRLKTFMNENNITL